MTTDPRTLRRDAWRQALGLAVLQGAIVFSYSVYNFYQPKLLELFAFTSLVALLPLLQGGLGIVFEPLMGALSDRLSPAQGGRFPLIFAGVTVAGLLFVVVSWVASLHEESVPRVLVPVLMLAWVAAMQAFRSPALSLLNRSAQALPLPLAGALLTVVGGAVGALGPLLERLLASLGPALAFLLGAGALLLGVLALRRGSRGATHDLSPAFFGGEATLQDPPVTEATLLDAPHAARTLAEKSATPDAAHARTENAETESKTAPSHSKQRDDEKALAAPGLVRGIPLVVRLAGAFLLGAGVGLGESVLLLRIPSLLGLALSGFSAAGVSAVILLVSSLAAIPLGWWTGRRASRGLALGMGGLLVALLVAPFNAVFLGDSGAASVVAWVLLLGTGASLGLVRNSGVPVILGAIPGERAALGIGMFFSGVSASFLLFAALMAWPLAYSALVALFLSASGISLIKNK